MMAGGEGGGVEVCVPPPMEKRYFVPPHPLESVHFVDQQSPPPLLLHCSLCLRQFSRNLTQQYCTIVVRTEPPTD